MIDILSSNSDTSVNELANPIKNFKNSEEEIEYLENELKELELHSKKSKVLNSEICSPQVYRIKTRISALKSIEMITKSLVKTRATKNLMQKFNKLYEVPVSVCHNYSSSFHTPDKPLSRANSVEHEKARHHEKRYSYTPRIVDKPTRSTAVSYHDFIDNKDNEDDKKISFIDIEEFEDIKDSNLLEPKENINYYDLQENKNNEESVIIKEDMNSNECNSLRNNFYRKNTESRKKYKEIDKIKEEFCEKKSNLLDKLDDLKNFLVKTILDF